MTQKQKAHPTRNSVPVLPRELFPICPRPCLLSQTLQTLGRGWASRVFGIYVFPMSEATKYLHLDLSRGTPTQLVQNCDHWPFYKRIHPPHSQFQRMLSFCPSCPDQKHLHLFPRWPAPYLTKMPCGFYLLCHSDLPCSLFQVKSGPYHYLPY